MKRLLVISLFIFPNLIFGQVDSVLSVQKINNQQGGLTGGPLSADDRFGFSVEVIGDVDHDGIDDVAVGAYLDDDGGTNKGAVYILMLNADGTVKAQQKISKISGNGPTDFSSAHYGFGSGITALGDLNGDGNVDIGVGMFGGGDKNITGYYGAIYILFLGNDGTVLDYRKISDNEGGGTDQLSYYDQFGLALANIGDLNGDGLPDLVVSSPRNDVGGTNRGAVYIINLDYNGTAKNIIEISDTSGGFTGVLDDQDLFGYGVAGVGDVDGDGIIDIAIASIYDDDGGTNRGAVWILFMNTDGTVKSHQKISDTVGGFTGILDDSDAFGWGLECLEDMDGDGVNELAVGTSLDDDGGTDKGAIWILYLDTDGTVKSYDKISSLDTNLSTEIDGSDRFGCSISSFGDRNNDGKTDLLVGAWNAHDSTTGSGEVYVLSLETNQTYPHKVFHTTSQFILDLKQHHITVGTYADEIYHNDNYGISSCSIGDLDKDGIDDLVVGSHGDNYSGGADLGSVFIEFLNTDGSIKSYQKITGVLGGFGGTLDYSDYFGYSVCSMGDLDGDGNTDIAVGAIGDDDGGTSRGAVWILFLDTNGTVKSEQKISDTDGNFTGVLDNSDQFGISIANIGDINDDGINDLAVGAHADDDGDTNTGSIWVLFLNSDGTVKSEQKISNTYGSLPDTLLNGDQFGYSVAGIGDIDGDNIPDIAVGSRLDDSTGTNSGAVYVLMMTDSGHVKDATKIISRENGFNGYIHQNDYFGSSLLGGYDFNSDGINDLIVGTPFADDSQLNRGGVWIIYLKDDGTVLNHFVINSTSTYLLDSLNSSEQFARSISMLSYDNIEKKAILGFGIPLSYPVVSIGYKTGQIYALELDLSALQEYSNNIFIDTRSFSEAILYSLELEGASYSYETGGIESILITDTSNTDTAIITVEATSSYGALELLFDLDGTQISNVRIVTDSLGGGDTLALDSNLYTISSNGQVLTLYERDTNDVSTDSLLYGFELQGGLGFSPDEDGDYDELVITGLDNIFYFNLTIKDIDNTTVFYTEDKSDFWNGKYMGTGSLMNRGTYQYTLNVNGESIEGQILLDY